MEKELLKKAVYSIVVKKHPGQMLVGEDAASWLAESGFGHARIATATGDLIGFDQNGMAAVGALANAIREPSSAYRRGVSHAIFAAAVADQLISTFNPTQKSEVDDTSVAQFEAKLSKWWTSQTSCRRHYIPCSILPEPAADVTVGPVTFVHANHVIGHTLGFSPDHPLNEMVLEDLWRALRDRSASWIGVVDVHGCHPARSGEIADLAVDVAISAIQLTIPLNYCRHFARVTARTAPPWRGNLTLTSGAISSGVQNNLPALGLSDADFSSMVNNGRLVLDAAGNRLTTFVTGQGMLPKIDQAWCDAAYWFHEGLAEPLDTIATAKLETAVEVLLCSESSKGSTKRMCQAIEAVTGLARKDAIADQSNVTVEQFAKSLVGARSRVLHGTLSTLMAELAPERSSLTSFAVLLLTTLACQIAAFAAVAEASDDIDALLEWISKQRAAASTAP